MFGRNGRPVRDSFRSRRRVFGAPARRPTNRNDGVGTRIRRPYGESDRRRRTLGGGLDPVGAAEEEFKRVQGLFGDILGSQFSFWGEGHLHPIRNY